MKKLYEKEINIKLSDVEEIKDFVKAAADCEFDIDVFYKRAIIDAKSLLGMLAVGGAKEMIVRYGGEDEGFEKVISKYAIA